MGAGVDDGLTDSMWCFTSSAMTLETSRMLRGDKEKRPKLRACSTSFMRISLLKERVSGNLGNFHSVSDIFPSRRIKS